MAERVIGLDIGTNAVRVADVQLGARPVLRAFGQVALPPGAMRDGEVVAADLVSAAIRRLWREVGIPVRRNVVRVGVASQRVVVRTIEMPAMGDAELEGALQFQVQEYIPIPVDDAILDFQVLEVTEADNGDAVANVLVAAAHRDTVAGVLAAVEGAGLRAAAVDLVPFALIRSLARPGTDEAEAIVSIGAGVTTVVVHQDGLPRFVRIVAAGGNLLTEAISNDLGVPTETAEAIKRRRATSADDAEAAELVERGDRVLQTRMLNLVGEVRGSLDFYAAQPGAATVERVLLTGGGSLTHGLVESLEPLVGVPVETARPRELLDVADIGFAPDELPTLDPYLPVPVGLALGGGRVEGRRITLLPRGARGAFVYRRALAGAGVAIGIVALLLVALTIARAHQVSDTKHDVARQQAQNAALQRRIAQFQSDQATEAQVTAARNLVQSALRTDVAWSRLLDDVARTIPNDVWLTAFQAQLTGASAPAPGAAGATATTAPGSAAASATSAGTATFTAVGLDFVSIASWLQRMADIPGFANLWVPSVTKTALGSRDVVNFTSNADVTPAARSSRLQQLLAGAQ